VRIRFQNYLFKADKITSHHLGHNRIYIYLLLTGLKYYCGKKSIIAALLATGNKPREN
jgi:hypothetical protein